MNSTPAGSLLVVTNGATNETSIALSPDFILYRDQKIKEAKTVFSVTTGNKALATSIVAELKSLNKIAEEWRVKEKAPFKLAGELIDDYAKKFKSPSDGEVSRVESLLAAYIREERDKAIKLEQERQAEEQRKLDEAKAKEDARLAEEQAERDRLAKIEYDRLEAIRLATEAKTTKARKEAADEAERLRLQALAESIAAAEAQEEREQARAEEAAVPQQVAVPVEVPKVRGASVTETWVGEVTDIQALYEAFPQAVKLEVRQSVLNDLIRLNGLREIPGVKITSTTNVAVAATK